MIAKLDSHIPYLYCLLCEFTAGEKCPVDNWIDNYRIPCDERPEGASHDECGRLEELNT